MLGIGGVVIAALRSLYRIGVSVQLDRLVARP
jgi:hypothetical protein